MDHKKMSYISGVIIFFGMVILLVSIVWLSSENILFTQDYTIYAKFPEVAGLRDQSPVFLRGYRIGTTKGVGFEPDGVVIKIDINKKYVIPRDSRVEITTLNLIGEKAISITPIAGGSEEPLKAGSTLAGENRDVMIIAQQVLSSLKKRIDDNEFDTKVRKLGESLDLFHSALAKLNERLDQLDVAEFTKQVKAVGEAGQSIRELVTATKSDVVDVTREGKEVVGKMNSALDRFQSLAQSLDSIAQKINSGQGTAGELVNNKQYITDLARAINEIQILLTDIRQDPHKYFKFSLF